MNIRRFVIYFFYIFLFSRFFSETLKLTPKYLDILNYPFALFLLFYLIIKLKKSNNEINSDLDIIIKLFVIFTIGTFLSTLLNINTILYPASILFYIGFVEGPLLYIVLSKTIKNRELMYKDIYKLFTILIFLNAIIVVFVNFPMFFLTGNPDVMSGSYGLNAAQFSVLIVIANGLIIGKYFIEKKSITVLIVVEVSLFVVYFFLQYRSALPLYLVVVILMLTVTYGKKILKAAIFISIFLFIIASISNVLIEEDDQVSNLRYQDWNTILEKPAYFLTFGKFKIYPYTLEMFYDNPETIIAGTGPGNYLSRANYTFSIELQTSFDKGVGPIIRYIFDIKQPHFPYYAEKYVNRMRSESILGTWQLANPNSSYIAPVAEVGILGISIIILYIIITKRSYSYAIYLKSKNNKYLPLAIASFGGFFYVFFLGFLDNWWETARMTLPIWLLYWASSNIANDIKNEK